MADPEASEWEFTGQDQIVYRFGLIALSTIIWGCLFGTFRHVLWKQEAEYSLRILSALHSFGDIVFVTLLYTTFENKAERYHYERYFLANAMGYIILDFIFCVNNGMESLIQLLNHVILTCTFSVYMFRANLRLMIVTGYAVLESTDPVLQLRWLLKQSNKPYLFVEYLFIITFIVTRLGVFSYYGYHILSNDTAEVIDKTLMSINYLMGVIFVVNILRYLVRKFEEYADEERYRSKASIVHR